MKIGELLVRHRILTQSQADAALAEQIKSGEPFGRVCERLFGVPPTLVEGAWAEQYASLVADVDARLDEVESAAEATVTRRQAWQFRVAPLRFEDGELVVATCVPSLPRALRFATSHIASPVFFVLVTPDELAAHLNRRFPMLGMDAEAVRRGFDAA
jgi:hypothetical protein